MDERKNFMLAILLCAMVLAGWQYFIVAPQMEQQRREEQLAGYEEQGQEHFPLSGEQTNGEGASFRPSAAPEEALSVPAPEMQDARQGARHVSPRKPPLAETPRVPIETPALTGGISLRGGRIDMLTLKRYRETLAPDSPNVPILSPPDSANPYFAVFGWVPAGASTHMRTPGATTPWEIAQGTHLAPGRPVTLRWDNGQGLVFRQSYEIDDRYMFTIRQSVENTGAEPVVLSPWSIIARYGEPDTLGFYILHEGALGVFDGELVEEDYDDLRNFDILPQERGAARRYEVSQSGWLGFTDKYWMTVMAPKGGAAFSGVFKATKHDGGEIFQTDMRRAPRTLAPGQSMSVESLLFSGAKEVRTIRAYEASQGLDRFEDSVDWGWFAFLTKPMFHLLVGIRDIVHNMGVAIILLTVIVKLALFPLAYKSYASMGRLKKLQPEMEKIKARCGDDSRRMQMEVMALYKREKVNPAAGCLPILLQIPIFFSLYKVLFVTIEMRQAAFFGWIRDLAAPDPTSLFTLFGLLPWTPPDLLHVGIFPILMGLTMWMQQKLSPTPTDKIQATVFGLMPVALTFLLARFPAGLVVYWTANNILTFAQQYVIMRRQGTEVDFFGNVKKSFRRRKS